MTRRSTSWLILCVDDADSCEAFKRRLSTYHVMAAHSAQTGTRLATRFPFGVYIVNSELPDSGAVAFCQAAQRFDPNVPIIVYNAPETRYLRSAFVMTGLKLFLVGVSSAASLTTMLASVFDRYRVEGLPSSSDIGEDAATQNELKNRYAARGARLQEPRQSQNLRPNYFPLPKRLQPPRQGTPDSTGDRP